MRTRTMAPHDKNAITYELITDTRTKQSGIKCLVCEKTSYNSNDVEHRYCGNCHQYHPVRNYRQYLNNKAA